MRHNSGARSRRFRLTLLALLTLWSLVACERPADVSVVSGAKLHPACLTDVVPLDLVPSAHWLSHWQPLDSKDCRPDSWLVRFPEAGQNLAGFRAAVTAGSPTPRSIQVAGFGSSLAARSGALLPAVHEFSELFFQAQVRPGDALGLPAGAAESLRGEGRGQYDAVRTLELLGGSCPQDTACLLLTDHDLYMPGLQYVFGLAHFRHRLSLVSLHRIWMPGGETVVSRRGPASVEPLRRLLKIAAHELAHQFSIAHCVHYRHCLMAGTSSVEENDRGRLSLCPLDFEKLREARDFEPRQRFRSLAAFAVRNQLHPEARYWQQMAAGYPQD